MIEDSIRIFARGTKNYPDYNLIIMGGLTPDSESYIKYLNQVIKEENISSKVRIIGNPSFEELKKELLNSKVLIESQRDISLTMTSIEALAAG